MAGSTDHQMELARQAAARLAGTVPRRRHPRPSAGPDTELVRAQLQQFLNRPQRGGPVVPPANNLSPGSGPTTVPGRSRTGGSELG